MIGSFAKIVAFVAAVAAYYGLLLYPNEQGRVQNKLEELWVRVDDRQKVALSTAAQFMRTTVRLTGTLLDGVFGQSLISFTSITVSVCFSMASLFGVMFLFLPTFLPTTVRPRTPFFVPLFFLSLFLLGWLSSRYSWARLFATGILLLYCSYAVQVVGGSVLENAIFLIVPLGGGLLCDIGFVTFTRWLLRWSQQVTSALACFIIFVGDVALGALLFIIPTIVLHIWGYRLGSTVFLLEQVGATNAFSFLVSLFLALVALVLLLHRILWPTAARLLFHVAPSKTQKALLFLLGTSLLTFALGKPLSGGLKELFRILSGA